ncbi:RidA family protein [Aestuariivirga sp. YIM B02566]|jgi:2-iminobutanoate/2-iminopropanoate deaminase|uniref:RidA family protein n=1 Tax=Taklimakanibacter albus TaxID=2800327 RepID=A0ACC5QWV5_9HYPH|nr:RidA family protein [Aestuariivirga sp. YIM B02566]MBK1864860.1 RidA family protein [Aestuariivirga sp. YIM B02566]
MPNDVPVQPLKRRPDGARQHRTAGPYSPVLVVEPHRLVVISGQVAVDLEGEVIGDTVEAQAEATLANCARQLASARCGFADVFKVNIYLADLKDWARFNKIYESKFKEPRPVRTAVAAGLMPGILVEIEMWAVKAKE